MTHSFSSLQQFRQCPHLYFRLRIARDVTMEETEDARRGVRVHAQLKDRLTKGSQLPPELTDAERLCAQLERIAQRSDPMRVEEELRAGDFAGKLDVALIAERAALVVDWKTGKPHADPDQLKMYALLTFENFPRVDEVVGKYAWLSTGEITTHKFLRADLEALRTEFETTVGEIARAEAEGYWSQRGNPACPRCPVLECRFNTSRDARPAPLF